MNTRTLPYLTAHITLHSDRFTRQQAVQHSGYSSLPLNQHPRVLVQCVVGDVKFLLEERVKTLLSACGHEPHLINMVFITDQAFVS